MDVRTSTSHPLFVDTLELPGGGRIGLTFCPGKKDPFAMTGAWDRDLTADLAAITRWGASTLVTLMETRELEHLGVPHLGRRAEALGLHWHHLPIRDGAVPDGAFEEAWAGVGGAIHRRLAAGQGVVVHCRGGLGRTGLVAARLLMERGEDPEGALGRVRAARPGAVETLEQEDYLRGRRWQRGA